MIAAGQQLGGYTIQRRIGRGQMGEVFLAQHRRIARRAAIKVLIPELSAKDAVIERFFKQARQSSLLTHPAIVGILDCDLYEGQAYVVMEFLHGESLGTYLKRNGALEGDMAFLLGLVAQVAGAVGAAHDAGIMHRGLKPENVYLHLGPPPATAIAVKVLDFGVAQLSRDDGGRPRTNLGMMLGKPEYLSPEQCRGVARPDEQSDIYALGCIFYEALCGQPPFVGQSSAEVLNAHVSATPKPPIKLVRDLPPKLNALIVKMLAKSPDERPRSMSEVVESLRASARAIGIDFEGALEPVVPVERPDVYGSGAEAGTASTAAPEAPAAEPPVPSPRSSTPLPAAPPPVPGPVAALAAPAPLDPPLEAPPPESPPAAARAPSMVPGEPPAAPAAAAPQSLPLPGSSALRQGSVARLADMIAAAARSEELAFPPRRSDTVPRTRLLDEDDPATPRRATAAISAVVAGTKRSGAISTAPEPRSSRSTPEKTISLYGLPGTQAPARPEPEPGAAELNALAGLAGGTQVLKPSPTRSATGERETRPERPTPSSSGAEPRVISLNDLADRYGAPRPEAEPGAAELSALAGLAGGTQVLKPSNGRPARPASRTPLPSDARAPGRPSAPTPSRTITVVISRAVDSWRQKPWIPVGVIAVVVVVAVLLAVTLPGGRRSGPGKTSAAASVEATAPAVRSAAPAPALAVAPAPAPAPREPRAPAAPVLPPPAKVGGAETVRIEVRGIPAGTTVTLDGRPARLPLLLPRGSTTHRMILRTPDGLEEILEVDGTKDRLVDWYRKGTSVPPAGGPALSPPPPPVVSAPAPEPVVAAKDDTPVPPAAVPEAVGHEVPSVEPVAPAETPSPAAPAKTPVP